MIRRFNYTGRQRIAQTDVQFAVGQVDDLGPVFSVDLALQEYVFPTDARVFIEAQRLTSFMRFDCGTVGAITIPPVEQRRLSEIGGVDAVSFRVKVVEPPSEDKSPARLLGLADGVRPKSDDLIAASSILEVINLDSGAEVWKIEFDDASHPKLALPPPLFDRRYELLAAPWFRALVLPTVLRAILMQVKFVDRHDDLEDVHQWRSEWLRFGKALSGSSPPSGDPSAATEEWIEEAVGAFSRRHSIRQRFEEFWDRESQA